MPLTRYTELYTATFAKRLCKAIQCSCHIQEQTVGYRTMFAHMTSTTEGTPEPKTGRFAGKFHPEHLYVDASSTNASSPAVPASDVPRNQSRPAEQMPQVRNLIQMAEKCAPRVGKVLVREGPLLLLLFRTGGTHEICTTFDIFSPAVTAQGHLQNS